MTTAKQYDNLNRLTSIASTHAGPLPVSFAYQYNDANQRTRMTLADGSYWQYQYDGLGQVSSGKRYWSDAVPVAGQQFEYAMSDIGNRTSTKEGGDAAGGGLRTRNYSPNGMNHGWRGLMNSVDILGMADAGTSVTVNGQTAYRKGNYFQSVVMVNTSAGDVNQTVTVTGGGMSGSGKVYFPGDTVNGGWESSYYDIEGNLTSQGRWDYTWDQENRLVMATGKYDVAANAFWRVEFENDWQGRRIKKTVSTTAFTPKPSARRRREHAGARMLPKTCETSGLKAFPGVSVLQTCASTGKECAMNCPQTLPMNRRFVAAEVTRRMESRTQDIRLLTSAATRFTDAMHALVRGVLSCTHRAFTSAFHFVLFATLPMLGFVSPQAAERPVALQAGLAVRDVTPELPIWLAGYAARSKPADKIDHPLLTQALALRSAAGARFVFISLDNCEVSHTFTAPVLKALEEKHGLKQGEVMIVSSHTHSAPVLADTLEVMQQFSNEERERVRKYSALLRGKLIEVAEAALADLKPAILEHGIGRATFAMNRRVYRDDAIVFGENPDGPVDWDVNVLKIKGANNAVRAVVFGYACHGTSIAGDDFYFVSGDFMGYARQHIESLYPGAVALYLTGMGADSNPSPRGTLLDAKRHGVELAGAVLGVLGRPMRPVDGALKVAFEEIELPFEDPPSREQLEKDSQSKDPHVKSRAELYLKNLAAGKKLPAGVQLPLAAIRIGDSLTFIAMGGEVVADYGLRFKRLFAAHHPWTIGYAYQVPCYIPSVRILKEGGYEAQSSLIYYGYYGPFRARIEGLLVNKMTDLVGRTQNP